LRWIFDLSGEQDGPGAGSESGLRTNEFAQLLKALLPQQTQNGGRLAAREDQAVDFVELFRLTNQHDLGAELLKPPAMRVEIALKGKHANLHAFILARMTFQIEDWGKRLDISD
jgi:hypothetical protein